MAVFPDSVRAWLRAEHTAVPLTDAPPVVTHVAWPAHSRSLALALAGLIRTATRHASHSGDSVDSLPDQIGMAIVPRVLLDHVDHDPAQRKPVIAHVAGLLFGQVTGVVQ